MDVALAIVHHLAAFGIVAAQAIEVTMLRGTLDATRLERLAKVDRLHLVALVLVAAAGAARVVVGPKGAAFYVGNPVFWIKVAAFAAIAALAVAPARRYLGWRDAARRDAAFVPAADDAAATRRQVFRAAHVVLVVLVAAPLMARGVGL
jgi:putative membrane protein